MIDLTVNIENDEDLALFKLLLDRLKISYHHGSHYEPATVKAKDYEKFTIELNALAGKKGEVSSFGDAAEYQREVRKDRKMPFRDE